MILSVPFCPYHFVPYHFVLEPFPLLHTCISFLHNSSLQKTPFITANRLIRCPGWMPGAVTPSAPPFVRHCDYGRLSINNIRRLAFFVKCIHANIVMLLRDSTT